MSPYNLQRSLLMGAATFYLALVLSQLQTKHAIANGLNHISVDAIVSTLRTQIIEAGELEQNSPVPPPAF